MAGRAEKWPNGCNSVKTELYLQLFRGVAQLAAHLVWDQRVLCSSHSTPTEVQGGLAVSLFRDIHSATRLGASGNSPGTLRFSNLLTISNIVAYPVAGGDKLMPPSTGQLTILLIIITLAESGALGDL